MKINNECKTFNKEQKQKKKHCCSTHTLLQYSHAVAALTRCCTQAAGIIAGDILVSADGHTLHDSAVVKDAYVTVTRFISGKKGTFVNLVMKRKCAEEEMPRERCLCVCVCHVTDCHVG